MPVLDAGADAFYNCAKFCTDNFQECIVRNITVSDVLTDYPYCLGHEECGCGNVARKFSAIHIRRMEYVDFACISVASREASTVFNDLLFEG